MGYGEAYFVGCDVAAELALDFGGEHVGHDGGLESGRVGVDQEEEAVFVEEAGRELDEVVDGVFDFPDFSFRAAAVGGRIHNDYIIVVSAADFSFDKFGAVVDEPADRGFAEAGGFGVFFCPFDHTF